MHLAEVLNLFFILLSQQTAGDIQQSSLSMHVLDGTRDDLALQQDVGFEPFCIELQLDVGVATQSACSCAGRVYHDPVHLSESYFAEALLVVVKLDVLDACAREATFGLQ